MSAKQPITVSEISSNFLNSSIEQANAFRLMQNGLYEQIQKNAQLAEEISILKKTIETQQEELLKLKKGTKD